MAWEWHAPCCVHISRDMTIRRYGATLWHSCPEQQARRCRAARARDLGRAGRAARPGRAATHGALRRGRPQRRLHVLAPAHTAPCHRAARRAQTRARARGAARQAQRPACPGTRARAHGRACPGGCAGCGGRGPWGWGWARRGGCSSCCTSAWGVWPASASAR